MMITISKPIPMAMRPMLRIHQTSRAHSGKGRTLGVNANTASSSLRLCQYSATTTAANTNNVPRPGSRVKLKLNRFWAMPRAIPPIMARGKERIPAMTAAASALVSV